MKRNLLLALLTVFLFGLTNCKKPNSDIFYSKKFVDEIKEARKGVFAHMTQNFVPGASVAIAKNGELIYAEGIGSASKELEVKATRKTKFRIGESSALFTNAIYQKMLEEGILSADSSVQHYYPEFPEKSGKITLFDLANELSGIRPATDNSELKKTTVSIEQGIKVFKDDPLETPPGLIQSPSAYNYNLLGVIMEKASGKKFRELLAEYVTDTLHLENTAIDNPFSTIKGRSDFYESNFLAQIVNASFYDLRSNAPSRGLLSNAEDMVKLGNAFLYSDYFEQTTRDSLFNTISLYKNMPSRMANCWVILQDVNGRTFYAREGRVPGGSSSIIILPEEKLVIAYACNVSVPTNETPVFKMAEAFLEDNEPE